MDNSRDIKYDIEAFLETQKEIIYNNLEHHLALHYDRDVGKAIWDILNEDNQIIVTLEDMTVFKKEMNDKLDVVYNKECS